MSNSYKEAMDRIKMSDELKKRIISAAHKGEKKRKFILKPAYIGAAAAAFAACAALVFALGGTFTKRSVTPVDEPVEIAQNIPETAAEPEQDELPDAAVLAESVTDAGEAATDTAVPTATQAPKATKAPERTGGTAMAKADITRQAPETKPVSGGAPGRTEQEPPSENTAPKSEEPPAAEPAPENESVMMAKFPEPAAESAAAESRVPIASAGASAASAPVPRGGGGGGHAGGGGSAAPKSTEKPTEKAEETETTGEE